jgi:hypothetical protein
VLGLLYTYPGGLLASLLLARPLLSFLLLSNTFAAALVAWYLIFYSPQDIFYRQDSPVSRIRIRDSFFSPEPGDGKNSGSGINIPDHISKSLVPIICFVY